MSLLAMTKFELMYPLLFFLLLSDSNISTMNDLNVFCFRYKNIVMFYRNKLETKLAYPNEYIGTRIAIFGTCFMLLLQSKSTIFIFSKRLKFITRTYHIDNSLFIPEYYMFIRKLNRCVCIRTDKYT